MRGNVRNKIFIIIVLLGVLTIFMTRFVYLDRTIISFPDLEMEFNTNDEVIEQTWQPDIKYIKSIKLPYYAVNSLESDIHLEIYNDDYSNKIVDVINSDYQFSLNETGTINFEFARTKVIPGERYRIRFSFENCSEEGRIYLQASSNHGGCSIQGEEQSVAVNMTISFAKFSKLFWMFSVLFPYIAISMFFMVITKKKFEETVAVSTFITGIILYIFACVEKLLLGMNLVYAISAICFLFSLYYIDKKRIKFKELFSPGLIIYFVLFIIIVLTSHGDWLGRRDDLRHWGSVVQDMFYYDSLAKHVNTTVLLPRYFPLAGIMEYIFVYMNGLYNEGIVLIGYQTLILNSIIIVTKILQKKRNFGRLFVALIIMVSIPIIFFNDISSTIIVDSLHAAIIACVLICYYSEGITKFNIVRITSGLITIVLIKDIGIVFAGILAMIMFGDIVMMQIKEKSFNLKATLYPIICVVIIIASYFSWQIYCSIPIKTQETKVESSITDNQQLRETEVEGSGEDNRQGQGESIKVNVNTGGISLGRIMKLLDGEGETYQYEVARKYLIEIFDGATYKVGPISLSFADIVIIYIFIIYSLGYWGIWNENRDRMYCFLIMMILGGFSLSLFLLVAYLFAFPVYDAVILACMDRYLAPYLCAVLILICYMVLTYGNTETKKLKFTIMTCSLLFIICTPINNLVVENKDIERYTVEENTYGHKEIREILSTVAKRGEVVQFICSDSDGYSEYIFRNAVCPLVSDHSWWNIVANSEIYRKEWERYNAEGIEYSANVVDLESFDNRLKDCQYLVLFHGDIGFVESYVQFFDDIQDIKDGSVYRVVNENGISKLRLIGTTGIKGWE